MKRQEAKYLKNRVKEYYDSQEKIFLEIKNKFHYHCRVFSIHDKSFMIIDKYNSLQSFDYETITTIDKIRMCY